LALASLPATVSARAAWGKTRSSTVTVKHSRMEDVFRTVVRLD